MNGPVLTVGRPVIESTVRLAALEVAGVARVAHGGAAFRGWLRGPAVVTRLSDGRVRTRLVVVARPNQPLAPLARQVRSAVGAALERLLSLELVDVTVLVDGVGA